MAQICLRFADQEGLDPRSREICRRIAERVSASSALPALKQDLARATKNERRSPAELSALMLRHGYAEKPGRRHIRLEPAQGYEGIQSLTLPTTPSDFRSLPNLRKQIERALGLTKLER